MKKLNVLVLTGFVMLSIFKVNGQNRKEVIEQLTSKSDSLQKLLVLQKEKTYDLELKLAKLEGAKGANEMMFKRIEDKVDSLTQIVLSRNDSIKVLNTDIGRLNTDIAELKQAHANALNLNAVLQTELNKLKAVNTTGSPRKGLSTNEIQPSNSTDIKSPAGIEKVQSTDPKPSSKPAVKEE